jgi:tripartite ATP-independent transporter DctM subunit
MTGVVTVLAVCFFVLLLMGMPLAFVMGITAMVVVLFKGNIPLTIIPQRMIIGSESFALMAIPFFILAGNLMNTGGVTKRIVSFANVLMGRLQGGLALADVAASMIFAGVTGSAVADATGVGSVLIPAMKKEGYDADFAAGLTAAASVCGPLIPPSIPMVVYAILAEVSIGAMFLAGAIPGFMLGFGLMGLAYYYSVKRNYPRYGRSNLRQIWREFLRAFLALIMPGIILGGIFSGVFTVTESAAVAVVYSLILSVFVYRELTLKDIMPILKQSAVDTAVVMFIIAVAALFGWMMAMTRLPQLVTKWMFSMQLSALALLMVLNVFLLIVGCFMEAISAMIILIPLLLVPSQALGIDRIHLGAIIVFNLMLGLLTPPVGLCLYITGRIADISLERVSKAAFPFLLVGIAVLILITVFPALTVWLPRVWLH